VALLAGRGFATSGEEHLRIISLDGDTPGIGQRPFLLDAQGLQVSPILLLANTSRAVLA